MRPRVPLLLASGLLSLSLVGGAVPASAAVSIVHAPRNRLAPPSSDLGWLSSNWSGYAITGSFTSVTGSWVVPAVSPSRKSTYSSSWVGIDGFNNSSLIQTGTEQDWSQGSAHYGVWWEILPAPATFISTFTVRPGDHMSATIQKGSGSSWTITINDTSNGGSFTTTQPYAGPGTSAEWIEEAPFVGGHLATLANYGSTVFDPGSANGKSPGLTASDGGAMIQHNVQVSTPSLPDSDIDGFAMQYGSSTPPAPAS